MFKIKEIIWLLLGAVLLGYVLEFQNWSINWMSWLIYAGLAIAALFIHTGAQKIIAYKLGCDIEIELWNLRQYGFRKSQYFRRPFPAWVVFPLVIAWVSFGVVKWLAVTVFDATPSLRSGKRFSELTEWELGLIALSGSILNIIFAVAFQYFNFHEFAMLNAGFAFFNLIPFSSLDGVKVFFGGKFFWMFNFVLTTIILILLGIANLTTTIIASGVAFVMLLVFFFAIYEAG